MNSEEKKAKITQLIEDNNFFEKWGTKNVRFEQLYDISPDKSQKIFKQHKKAYPKIAEFAKNYLNRKSN